MSIPVWHTPAGFLGTLTERKTISNYVTIEKSIVATAITSPGIGYSQGIKLEIGAPQSVLGNNVQASIAVGVDADTGAIVDTVISNAGSGYAVPPLVTIVKPDPIEINPSSFRDSPPQ